MNWIVMAVCQIPSEYGGKMMAPETPNRNTSGDGDMAR